MNITVLGPGAIGSLWAVKLAQAGHNVMLWQRPTTDKAELQLDDDKALEFPVNQKDLLNECDLLLVTVKAWQVEQALLPLLPHLAPETIIVLMHNGMGAVDTLAEQLNSFPVVLATTTQAALKTAPDRVRHTGKGTTQLGGWNAAGKRCDFLADVFNHALNQAIWNPDINQALWQKLAINCAINPLTAIHQCPNGDLALEQYHPAVIKLVEETCQVMNAEGMSTNNKEMLALVNQVITATAANLSSMNQDIAHNRPTEIDFINGYVVKCARRHSLPVPANQQMVDEVKQIEQTRS